MTSSEIEITFRRITSENVSEVCELSETLPPEQREMVADNGVSIAEGFCSQATWFRAVYLDETLVGFVMVNDGDEWDDGIECDGPYLWRLMIAAPHQGAGLGRRVVELVKQRLRRRGYSALYTSYGLGEGSPEAFYQRLGFAPTGGHFGEEVEVCVTL